MKYVLFDLDGTVADTKEGVTRSVQYALGKMGVVEESLDELEKFIGPPLYQSYKEFYGFTEEQIEMAVKYYRDYYNEKGMLQCYIYPGMEKILEKLHNSGVKVILATSKPEHYAKKILKHFDLAKYFDVIAGSTLTKERTTKSDVIRYAISGFDDFDAKEAYMIGDRKFDYIGAREFGIPCILIGYGYGSMEELEECKPFAIKETVEELSSFFDTL